MRIIINQKRKSLGPNSISFLILFALSLSYCFRVTRAPMVMVGVMACVISLYGFFRSYSKHNLLMQIDDTGIFDRRLGLGKIRWVDVEDVQLQVTEENRFLCFRLHNPEPYLAQLTGAARERVFFQKSLGFHGINVDVGPVDLNLLELKKQIEIRVGRRAGV